MHHHFACALPDVGRCKDTMPNKISNKACGWPVVQRVRFVPLVQLTLVHHTNTVPNRKRLQLVVCDKQSCGSCGLQNAAHLMGQTFTQINIKV